MGMFLQSATNRIQTSLVSGIAYGTKRVKAHSIGNTQSGFLDLRPVTSQLHNFWFVFLGE